MARIKQMSKNDAVTMIRSCAKKLSFSNRTVTLCYALSLRTLKDEMAEFDKYNQMNISEFQEFIGRLADLQFADLHVPMDEKIFRLLKILLILAETKPKRPSTEDDVPSDTDCDDDWVDDFV